VDSPRIDLKQNPLYEDSGMSFFKTHYYGGIKKYQWTASPLALHGVVVLENGERVTISIGEAPADPVFYINDLLPHLGQEQAQQPLGKAITGETLNLLVGGIPVPEGEDGKAIKLNVLRILNEKYGITEGDFLSAELSLVPAFKARDIGFDRALMGAYGHDDRVCAYPALTALINADSRHTVLVALADKEETGSDGITGMQSDVLVDIIDEISSNLNKNGRVVRSNSKCLSADVSAAFDPNFAEVSDRRNNSMLNYGISICKYTGSRGKGGASDASAEAMGHIRTTFDNADVIWQIATLGKVDQGGGGTVAAYMANRNIVTVDAGVPVLNMHAPIELAAKLDCYMCMRACKAIYLA
jgi:aspartyl aminopeptidase